MTFVRDAFACTLAHKQNVTPRKAKHLDSPQKRHSHPHGTTKSGSRSKKKTASQSSLNTEAGRKTQETLSEQYWQRTSRHNRRCCRVFSSARKLTTLPTILLRALRDEGPGRERHSQRPKRAKKQGSKQQQRGTTNKENGTQKKSKQTNEEHEAQRERRSTETHAATLEPCLFPRLFPLWLLVPDPHLYICVARARS